MFSIPFQKTTNNIQTGKGTSKHKSDIFFFLMKHEGLEKLSRLGHVVYQGGDRISRVQSIIFLKKYTGEGRDEMDKCSGFQTQKVACRKSESEEAWNLMAR